MAKRSKDPYAALRHREFNLFLFVRFALVFAWSMQFVIIEWQVYDLTKDPLSLGIIGLMEIIPAVCVALFAGHIVDQREKRQLLSFCILGFTMLSLGLFLITWPIVIEDMTQKLILYIIYGLVFLGGIVRAFIGPTIFALFGLVVPKALFANGTTWSSSVWQLGAVVGAAVAGLSIYLIGVHWSLCVVVLFAIIAFVCLMQIPKKPILNKKLGEPVMKSLTEGLSFVFKTKIILGALMLDMFAVLFGGAVALLPIYAQDILKVGPEGFGVLRAAPAVGALLIMFTSAYFPLTKNAGYKLLAAIFGFGICIIVFGLSSWFWISVVALFLSGVTDGISMIIRQTILQMKTPDEMRGRVSSVNSIFVGSSNELGAFESGVTAKLMGTVNAVVFGGIMTLSTVSFTAICFPKLRRLQLTDEKE